MASTYVHTGSTVWNLPFPDYRVLVNDPLLVDLNAGTCDGLFHTGARFTRIETTTPPALRNADALYTVLYFKGPNLSCDQEMVTVYTRADCSYNDYLQCPLVHASYISDVIRCHYECTCPAEPCDKVYMEAYQSNWHSKVHMPDWEICEMNIGPILDGGESITLVMHQSRWCQGEVPPGNWQGFCSLG